MTSVWLLLFACHWIEPVESSEQALVGRVLAPGGFPVKGLRIDGLEMSDFTDDDGHFAVSYKEDSAYVVFQQDATWFRRVYLPEDAGQVVDLQLPGLSERLLECRLPTECRVRLEWPQAEGFVAWTEVPCRPQTRLPLPGVPAGTPEVRCNAGTVEVPAEVTGDERIVRLVTPRRPVRVTVTGVPPEVTCELRTPAGEHERTSPTSFVVRTVDGIPVSATCSGRPSTPVPVPAGGDAVEVPWSAEGPELRLPGDDEIILVGPSWDLSLRAEEGRFLLPPLDPGTYRLSTGGITALMTPKKPEGEPGVLVIRGDVGVWELPEGMGPGTVEVRRIHP